MYKPLIYAMLYTPRLPGNACNAGIGLLYHMAIAKGFRRVSRKRVAALDIDATLREALVANCSLQICACLLKGVVKVWLVKIGDCAEARGPPSHLRRIGKAERAPALCLLSTPNMLLGDACDDESEENENGVIFDGEGIGILNYRELMGKPDVVEEPEEPRFAEDASGIIDLPYLPAKKTRIDTRCVLSATEMMLKSPKAPMLVLPKMPGCPAIDNLLSCLTAGIEPLLSHGSNCFDDSECAGDMVTCLNEEAVINRDTRRAFAQQTRPNCPVALTEEEERRMNEKERQAQWFYELLENITAGINVVQQLEPYGEIIIN